MLLSPDQIVTPDLAFTKLLNGLKNFYMFKRPNNLRENFKISKKDTVNEPPHEKTWVFFS